MKLQINYSGNPSLMEEQLLTHILVYYNVNKTIDKALDQPISINCSACVLNVNLSDHNLALLVK